MILYTLELAGHMLSWLQTTTIKSAAGVERWTHYIGLFISKRNASRIEERTKGTFLDLFLEQQSILEEELE